MTENRDLVWDLDKFQKRRLAHEFVLSFENKICIFSGSVQQLYTNYNIFFPKEEERRLVILPDPYAPHDTFHGLLESSVVPTGMLLVPADPSDSKGDLNLIIPLKNQKAKYRRVPLNVGLSLINRNRPEDKPFLPVLVKGDLRELNADTPCLHLHSLILSKLSNLSGMDVTDIRQVILDRLEALAAAR